MSQHSIPYGEGRIHFALRRQPRRTPHRIAIHVEPDGRILVDAAPDAPLEQVRAAVAKRAHWLSRHIDEARKRMRHVLPREYVSGESVLYLGRRYRLRVVTSPDTVVGAALRGAYLEVRTRTASARAVSRILDAWYRDRAREFFRLRLTAIAEPLRWVREAPPLRVQAMTRQWGSCSPAGRITLNPALVRAPRDCIDYVILHELCHLAHHNHSVRFYRALGQHMPQWPQVKARLDDLAEALLLG